MHFRLRGAMGAALRADAALLAMDASITEGRRLPMPQRIGMQVNVDLVDSQASPDTLATNGWQTRMFVECSARADAEALAEARADQLLAAAVSALLAPMAIDPAGEVEASVVAANWYADDTDTQVAGARAVLSLRHRTALESIAA